MPRRRSAHDLPGLIGVGLDGEDGHRRVTRGEDFLLLGGSEETHACLQEVAVKVTERLARDGRRVRDLTAEEFRDLADGAIG